MPPSPHTLVVPLLGLVGVWVGDGSGSLPGGEPFEWQERFEIGHGGTPALWFRQRTTRPDGSPFHAEDGWLRVPPELQDDADDLAVEAAVAGPTGVLEALVGRCSTGAGVVVDVHSTGVVGTPASAPVLSTRRRWTLTGDVLMVEFWMATPTFPERFHHLTAELRRAAADGR